MMRVVAVWGDARLAEQRAAFQTTFLDGDPTVRLNAISTYAWFDVGPSAVHGPVIARVPPASPDGESTLVVHIDQEIPAWVTQGVPTEWGWAEVTALPPLSREPFQVDVLLLAENGPRRMQGWSTTAWIDAGFRPMQRLDLQVDPDSLLTLPVRVLECGVASQGTGYAVVYCPDLLTVRGADLRSRGWWSEPWVQIRGEEWNALAELSSAVETDVLTLMRSPIVAGVRVHDLLAIPDRALPLLPRDVRDALQSALTAIPDEPRF